MKKILSIIAIALVFACQSNDDKEEGCENRLWNLVQNGENYLATYGPTEASAGTISVNQQTYDYYTGLGNVTDGSLCWEGTKE